MAAASDESKLFDFPEGELDNDAKFEAAQRMVRCRRGSQKFLAGFKLLLTAADNGHPGACLLASQLYSGTSSSPQARASQYYLRQSLARNYPPALAESGEHLVAFSLVPDRGTQLMLEKGMAQLQLAARAGNSFSQGLLQLLLRKGPSLEVWMEGQALAGQTDKDSAQIAAVTRLVQDEMEMPYSAAVRELLTRAADAFHPEACWLLGELHCTWKDSTATHHDVEQWLRWAANGDFPHAEVLLIRMLAEGLRGEVRSEEARELAAAAVASGNMHAAAYCGSQLHFGTASFPQDIDESARLLRLAATGGSHAATIRLAFWRLTGQPTGLPPAPGRTSAETVQQLLQDMLHINDTMALTLAGYAAWSGRGGAAHDPQRGAAMLHDAARQGSIHAAPVYTQSILQGVLPSDLLSMATKIVGQAAAGGHLPSLLLLADMHAKGRGLPRDRIKAATVLQHAICLGYTPARDALRALQAEGPSIALNPGLGVSPAVVQQLGPSLSVNMPALPAERDVLTGAFISVEDGAAQLPATLGNRARDDACALTYFRQLSEVQLPLPNVAGYATYAVHDGTVPALSAPAMTIAAARGAAPVSPTSWPAAPVHVTAPVPHTPAAPVHVTAPVPLTPAAPGTAPVPPTPAARYEAFWSMQMADVQRLTLYLEAVGPHGTAVVQIELPTETAAPAGAPATATQDSTQQPLQPPITSSPESAADNVTLRAPRSQTAAAPGQGNRGWDLYTPQHSLQQALNPEGYEPGSIHALPNRVRGAEGLYRGVTLVERHALGPDGTPSFDRMVYIAGGPR